MLEIFSEVKKVRVLLGTSTYCRFHSPEKQRFGTRTYRDLNPRRDSIACHNGTMESRCQGQLFGPFAINGPKKIKFEKHKTLEKDPRLIENFPVCTVCEVDPKPAPFSDKSGRIKSECSAWGNKRI